MKKLLLSALTICFLSALVAQPCQSEYKMGQTIIVNKVDQVGIPLYKRKYVRINAIPPRFQWNIGNGYCGEVSMISAGLYYGQYLPQYDVREYAAPGQNQQQQLLLGVNDGLAASSLKFNYERIESNDNAEFLTWAKHHVALGHPVIIGVLNNEYILYDSTNMSCGDPKYDHIVPVIGFYSNKPLNSAYHSSDIILYSDNGVYTPNDQAPIICSPPHTNLKNGNVPYYYSARLDTFCLDRQQANDSINGPVYSLLRLPKNNYTNYGIAIMGVQGNPALKPVRITTDYNYETPCLAEKHPEPSKTVPIELTIQICSLTKGKKYDIYYYTNMSQVPIGDARQDKKFLWKQFTAEGKVHIEKKGIDSWTQAIFRVVEAGE